jgi:hypothetical protein
MITANVEAGMNENYASVADGREGIPAPSQRDQELLLDAWREALAEVLASRDHDWRQDLRAMRAEGSAAVAELRASAAEIHRRMATMVENRLAQIREPADGPRGEAGPRGEPGAPGKIEHVHKYVEGSVHYRADVVSHRGATFQALCDTAREPPHDDWICLAAAGRDAPMPRVRGTFSETERYLRHDIVALGGSSFIARKDNPGPCPGADWQLIASAGKPGRQGIKGERGEAGAPGPQGAAAPIIVGWQIDRAAYTATPVMSDGGEGPPLELRTLFEQFHSEAG